MGLAKATIFWDVDTQFDFMHRDGKLYVPGAEEIIKKVSEVRRYALRTGHSLIASMDWHTVGDEEISIYPDFKQTFPPHCEAGKPGSERVGFLGTVPREYVKIERMNTDDLRKLVDKKQFHIVIRKSTFDVFSNPNTAKLLDLIKPKVVLIFGVALDVCVYQTIRGLLKRRDVCVCVFNDVVKGLGIRRDEDILEELQRKMGVQVTRFHDFKR